MDPFYTEIQYREIDPFYTGVQYREIEPFYAGVVQYIEMDHTGVQCRKRLMVSTYCNSYVLDT